MSIVSYSGMDQPAQGPGAANETVAQILDQTLTPLVLDQHTPLRSISKLMQADSTQVGVLIAANDGEYIPLYRDRMFLNLARAYAKDLYYHRPVIEFARQHHLKPPLTLPQSTPVSDAIEAAVTREPNVRYDPVLITHDPDMPPRMIDVRILMERQRELLSHALQQVDQQRHEAHLAALTDRLTGLPNRQSAMARLGSLSRAHTKNPDRDYAVLFLDYDRFKLINDSLGHDAGDDLLIQIAERLEQTLITETGQDETAGRWMTSRLGGDEFLVLIDNIADSAEAEGYAKAILKAMRPTYDLRGYSVSSSPSIGIATCDSSEGTNPAAMVRDADVAMYRAKSQGRARYILFDKSLQDEALERLHLESQLRPALESNQFSAYYQPIVDCESGEVAGFEALARWHHPELGMISPGKFIPIAEECGVISEIGKFMLETAIQQLAEWNSKRSAQPPLYMSINVSKRQLLQPGCIEHLAEVLERTRVDPKSIYLEITETVVMDYGSSVVDILETFKQLGVRLSMDDFGTGLSSLTHLHKYPVDVLKIDQAFVRHLEEKSMYTAVVLAIVTLAKNMGMSIVVEGIERVEQLVQIQTLDCEYAQGYLFSKPVPADEAEKLIESKPNTGRAFNAA